jgi:hypothetical protein
LPENLKEGMRYQVCYSDREYENTESELAAQPTPFNHSHDYLDLRKNWIPLANQTPDSAESEFNR